MTFVLVAYILQGKCILDIVRVEIQVQIAGS